MKTELKMAVALTAAALVCGCASGGGGSQHSEATPRPSSSNYNPGPSTCVGFGCLFGGSSWLEDDPDPVIPPPSFKSWSELPRYGVAQFGAVTMGVVYTQSGWIRTMAHTDASITTYQASPKYESEGEVSGMSDPLHFDRIPLQFYSGAQEHLTLKSIGQSGIDVVLYPHQSGNGFQNPFTTRYDTNVMFTGNPTMLGWEYQSFGIWNNDKPFARTISLLSFGAATPGSAVPTVGNATFSGKLAALYLSPNVQGSIATADLTVNADFSKRSLSFASSGTSLTRDLATATAAPNLNLSGTLTYSPGSSTFAGTLTNAGGTMSGASKGQFYGPAAQELGGVFTVTSATSIETLAGAYGAKR